MYGHAKAGRDDDQTVGERRLDQSVEQSYAGPIPLHKGQSEMITAFMTADNRTRRCISRRR